LASLIKICFIFLNKTRKSPDFLKNTKNMDKIAIIKTGGKQYKARQGQTLKVEKIEGKEGDKVKFDTLLIAQNDGGELNLGQPSLGEKVEGKIVEQGKDEKVNVVKYKNKTRYKRTIGHKQPFTKVEITSIS
jgi:large subunit ribosomal protein L21